VYVQTIFFLQLADFRQNKTWSIILPVITKDRKNGIVKSFGVKTVVFSYLEINNGLTFVVGLTVPLDDKFGFNKLVLV